MSDEDLVEQIRAQFLAASLLCKQARERDIRIHLWDGGSQQFVLRDGAEIKVLAETAKKL